MKKDKLIKLLLSIEGNPDILLWNGYARDWMDIKGLKEADLVKMTKDYYVQFIEIKEKVDRQHFDYILPESEKEKLYMSYKKDISWETNEYITHEDIKKKRYDKKRIIYIKPKLRGKNMTDRHGPIEY